MAETLARSAMPGPEAGRVWTVDEYLDVCERGFEYVDGCLKQLPVPTDRHQDLVSFLYESLRKHSPRRNLKLPGYRIRTADGRYREPDIAYVADLSKWKRRAGVSADLAIEVVSDSPADRDRDLITKRFEYERAGISEYWIVEPQNRQVTLLTLDADGYVGEPVSSGVLRSSILAGFEVNVATLWNDAVQ